MFDEGVYTDTPLELSPEAKEKLEASVALSGWNAKDIPSGGVIGDDITDLLNTNKWPEGATPKEALDLFEERDPERFNKFLLRFGTKEALLDIVKETRGPLEFWYRLSNALEL